MVTLSYQATAMRYQPLFKYHIDCDYTCVVILTIPNLSYLSTFSSQKGCPEKTGLTVVAKATLLYDIPGDL